MKRFPLTLLFAPLALCAIAAAPIASEISEITLERTACFGTCPVYKVTVKRDGNVTFEGTEFVKETGMHSGKISGQQFQQLAAKIEQIGFLRLRTNT